MGGPELSTTLAGTVLVANPSADLYGSDRMLLEAVRGFTRHGWRTTVTCSVDGPLVGPLREAGAEVRVQAVPIVRKRMLTPRGFISFIRDVTAYLPKMRRIVKDVQPDVVFVNTVTIPFWCLVARASRTPVLVYVHEAEAGLARPARALLTTPLRLATGVVFNSETSRRVSGSTWLTRRGRARVVPNGVNGPRSEHAARKALDGPLRVVYVGRLSPRKGVDLVVDAVANLAGSGVATSAVIVGDVFPGYEWYEAELRERVTRVSVEDHVTFAGFQREVWDQLASADIAVVPSRQDESFGNVLIEAILSARPVVAADHSGLREAAASFDSVVLVKPDDPVALAEGIRHVREHWTEYRRHAARDAERARALFSTELFQTRLSHALTEAVDHNSTYSIRTDLSG